MTQRFTRRRAIVTGASRGIGAGIAQRLCAEGADVVLVARTLKTSDGTGGSLHETQQLCEKYGTTVGIVVADITDDADRSRVIPEATAILGGPIDILVNNAAAATTAPITEITPTQQRLAYEANVIAPLALAQTVIPAMRESGQGWIVNLTSVGATVVEGPPFYLGPQGSTMEIYGATKAALNRTTAGLAGDLYGTGIRVNAVGPRVAVMSEGFAELMGDALPAEFFESVEEVVEAVVALCDCDSETTGKIRYSLDLIEQWKLDVRELDGSPRARDGQP
ncbi:short-chain dehydrogenase [Mycolicibacterium fortuitum]|uniref:3-oxoacyl-[acyl-carrier-protein] reductase MabA n=1 Tax=Mycolicibacterium fortuitum TaxID=1766 RepID=A0A378UA97_MYCFO|nr:short-chain dehydrogenase [Mycolicibacterium fortuitum]